jgi:hypothetical protein
VNLDWPRLRAVVIQSDDWGLCAWSPDDRAHAELRDTPMFRSDAGRRYAGSTLESAADVAALCATLQAFRGADGFAPVWQANTTMASPDYERMTASRFGAEVLPVVEAPGLPSRWQRPGLAESVDRARSDGLWWPELHGLHHLPEHAWLHALRRGESDAVRAFEQQSPVCRAVQESGEYDSSEPRDVRRRNLERSIEAFRRRFARAPESLCPPDYRWDESLEQDAQALGIGSIQGLAEQYGHSFPRLRHLALRQRWPITTGRLLFLPARIAFEPSAVDASEHGRLVQHVRKRARQAWGRGQPAIVSTHRVNYAHLDPERSAAGRLALREVIAGLVEDGARFLVDTEVRQLLERGGSVRRLGTHAVIVRRYGAGDEPMRFEAPAGVTGVHVREGRAANGADARIEHGELVARLDHGELLLEWTIRV